MKRNVSLAEISDGKLYTENDMVKADCRGCAGCSDCCRGMGESIILDPYDAYRLSRGLNRPFAGFLEREIELHVVDGVILPNLKMAGPGEACAFLNEQGRCSIHPYRPGICRIFPLGRYYENGTFQYFLQTGECKAAHSKIKVSKWIDTPDQKRNREFVTRWHYLLKELEELLPTADEDKTKQINMGLLQLFFFTDYDEKSEFYEQFNSREQQYRNLFIAKNMPV
ncbi:MAG: YkgJ family cysteine cluster protein [Lachnospiraceae bacterium]|nr:YkgJ family cysteine cluster protein [Lachnospiraceae bacterium]MBQ8118637.1 YkgJ family cysteine cluster protein [Lachnospiraceae bacterium]